MQIDTYDFFILNSVLTKNIQKVHNSTVNISMLPKTSLGKWSLYLAIAFILVFALFVVLTEVPTDFNGPPPGFNPVALLTLEVIVITAAGATFITGLISVLRNKERSVLVFIGMVITFWLGLIGAVGQFLI